MSSRVALAVPLASLTLAMGLAYGESASPAFAPEASRTSLDAGPHVVVWTDDGWLLAGEILQDLRDPSLAAARSLPLPRSALRERQIVVRLTERKVSVASVDALWIEVDGRKISPEGCPSADPSCHVDGSFVSLGQGDEIEYVFDVGETEDAPILWAHGHDVPMSR